MSDAKKIGDAKLAQKVIEAYADLEGLTRKECAKLLPQEPAHYCGVIVDTLGKGAEGEVTADERAYLEKVGFAKEFVDGIAGSDGKKALRERVKWLGEHAITKWWRRDASHDERVAMIGELFEIGEPASIAILDILSDDEARSAMIEAIKRSCSSASVVFRNLLDHYGPNEGVRTIKGLGSVGDAFYCVAPTVIFALGHYERGVKHRAEYILEGAGYKAVPALIDALGDVEYRVRWRAAEMLGRIGPDAKDAVPALTKALKDQDTHVREAAAEALGNIGPAAKDAVPALTEALRDQTWVVMKKAAEALGKIGFYGRDAIGYLVVELGNHYTSSQVARNTLVKIGGDAAPAVSEVLGDKDPQRREDAAWVLVKIGAPSVPALSASLSAEEKYARFYAAWALGEIGKPAHDALPFLEPMSDNDPDPNCKKVAGEAVEKILKDVK